jgi:hypothetical protein
MSLANSWNVLCPLYLFTGTSVAGSTTPSSSTTTPPQPIAQQYNEASKL